MSGLTSLQQLQIIECQGLASLPRGMMSSLASLENLVVDGCPGIKSLPQDTKGLTTLMGLRILGALIWRGVVRQDRGRTGTSSPTSLL
jgi:hypothetical protein